MKKKILFVLNHFQFSDGVASTLRSLIMNIDPNRYDIHILPLFRFDRKFLDPVRERVTLHRGFGFYFRGFSLFVKFLPLRLLYRLFVQDKYDLEVAYQYGLSTKIISVSPNPHKICWMHGYDKGLTLREYYKAFNKVISVAKVGSIKLKQAGFSDTDYCYNIIDETNIIKQAQDSVNLPKKRKYIVTTVCRIAPDKAIIRQLRCIERINRVTTNAEFWIVGGGPDFEKAEAYVNGHNMQEYVRLVGAQSNPFKYLKHSDLFLLASLHEGFNTACQEAAILGIPVVSTEVDGAHELVEIAGCGEVIPNDEQAITERLTAILSDDNLISSWKQTAFANRHRFYKQPRIGKIEQTLDNAMGKNSSKLGIEILHKESYC